MPSAARLIVDAGLHGHTYALYAMLSVTALDEPGPVSVLGSDPEGLTALCGSRITGVKVWRRQPRRCAPEAEGLRDTRDSHLR